MIDQKNNKGFTLIEVVIYIALFSLLIGSAFVTAYQIIDGTNKISVKTTTQEEGNFLMRKINWALTGLDPTPANAPVVTGPSCNQTLTINKLNHTANPIVIRLNTPESSVEIKQGTGAYNPITTENVKVTCLKFSKIPPVGSGPSGVSATTTINGIDFTITKYQRI